MRFALTITSCLLLLITGLAFSRFADANGQSLPAQTSGEAHETPAGPAGQAQQQVITPTIEDDGFILAPGYTEQDLSIDVAGQVRQPAEPVTTAVSEALFDFGVVTSTVEPGWQQVTTTTLYSEAQGYGWLASTPDLDAQDQGARGALLSDYVSGVQPATFRVDLLPGTYEIWLAIHNEGRSVPLMTVNAGGRAASLPMPRNGDGGSLGTVLYDPTLSAISGFPTYDYIWNIAEQDGHLDITLSAAGGYWQINALAIRQQQSAAGAKYSYEAEITLPGSDLSPSQELQPQIPQRFWYNSLQFGDADRDWQYMLQWRDQYIDDSMTPAQKMRALLPAIRNLTGAAVRGNHPVDNIIHGGWCTGLSWLTVMAAWSLGLPARSIDLFTDAGIDLPAFLPGDPFGMMTGSSHTVAEVYMDGGWHMIDLGWERPGSAVEYLDELAPYGTQAQWHITGARELVYQIWDGAKTHRVVYSPSTAPLLYPDSVNHPFRLVTHDPRTPRLLRFDSAAEFNAEPIRLEPGSWLEKRFWLPPLPDDVERIYTRIPLLQPYEGAPIVDDWTIRVNNTDYRLGQANADWPLNGETMLTVEISKTDLVTGWNTLQLGAPTVNPDETVFIAASYEASSSRSRLINRVSALEFDSNPVWFIDWEFAAGLDPLPPDQVLDLHANGWRGKALELQWTIPGDDGPIGRAHSFELRYLDKPIDYTNWLSATIGASGTYSESGETQQAWLEGLQPETNYYFAVVSVDDSNRVSRLSLERTVYAYDHNRNPHYYASPYNVNTEKSADVSASVLVSDLLYTDASEKVQVEIANGGPSSADVVTASLKVLGGAQLLSAPAGCLLETANTLNCQVEQLAPGALFTFTAPIQTSHAEPITATEGISIVVEALSDSYDPDSDNNTRAGGAALLPHADLQLVRIAPVEPEPELELEPKPEPILAGSIYTYSLRIYNHGPNAAMDTLFNFQADPFMHVVAVQPPDFACTGLDGRDVACTTTSLPAASAADVQIITQVDPAAGGDGVSTARITSGTADLAAGNNLLTLTDTYLEKPWKLYLPVVGKE